jgi:hypothetical protein
MAIAATVVGALLIATLNRLTLSLVSPASQTGSLLEGP